MKILLSLLLLLSLSVNFYLYTEKSEVEYQLIHHRSMESTMAGGRDVAVGLINEYPSCLTQSQVVDYLSGEGVKFRLETNDPTHNLNFIYSQGLAFNFEKSGNLAGIASGKL